MAIGSQLFHTPLPQIQYIHENLPALPSSPKPKLKKKEVLYTPDFENKKLGSRKQQRLLNIKELLKFGCENIEIDTFNFRHNPFENLVEEDFHSFEAESEAHDGESFSCKGQGPYRLCRHEKEIRGMVKRNRFGYERVSSVEILLKEFISHEKSGQLSLNLKDSFERLLIHVLCRYYGLDSYSVPDSQGKIFLINFDGKAIIPSETFCDFFYV